MAGQSLALSVLRNPHRHPTPTLSRSAPVLSNVHLIERSNVGNDMITAGILTSCSSPPQPASAAPGWRYVPEDNIRRRERKPTPSRGKRNEAAEEKRVEAEEAKRRQFYIPSAAQPAPHPTPTAPATANKRPPGRPNGLLQAAEGCQSIFSFFKPINTDKAADAGQSALEVRQMNSLTPTHPRRMPWTNTPHLSQVVRGREW
jgi:hypothetical protein